MRAVLVALALATLTPSSAEACGGFVCNPQQPVYQAGEEIVFAVDEDACEVSAHVAIQYEGAAEDFAWIVPVGGEPELFSSSSTLFSALRAPSDPQYNLTRETRGVCQLPTPSIGAESSFEDVAPQSFEDGVTVVGEERVGPYETVILQALNADVLLDWLQTEGYDLPSDLTTVLQPYVADNQYFVALKLASGQDAGDLTPLGMRYDGCTASVPLQLTAIAANPDMPVDVYVLGEARAVPDNYLHVTLNDAAVDWYAGGGNAASVLSTAADEAGGQAFATTFAGAVAELGVSVFDESRYDSSYLATLSDPASFVNELGSQGIAITTEVVGILEDMIPMPADLLEQGVTPANFYACLECWGADIDISQFDAVVAAELVDAEVVPGLREAQAALDAHRHITRMTTTMDPGEMTVDPMFVFNQDLPQRVSNVHTAVDRVNCGFLEGNQGAERVLELEDGREIKLPSRRWLQRHDMTESDVLAELATPAAILIEDFGAEGMGEVVFDYREEAAVDARRMGRAGCACTTGSSPLSMSLLALLLPVVLRRRS